MYRIIKVVLSCLFHMQKVTNRNKFYDFEYRTNKDYNRFDIYF